MMSPAGLAAALSHMVFHALMKICSFFCAGAVMHQTGKTYIYQLDGLGKEMPVTFGCLTVASLSLVGIPLFAGFISKWNIIQAAFARGLETESRMGFLCFGAGAVLLYSALMTAVYMLTVLVRAYFPKAVPAAERPEGDGWSRAGKDVPVKDPNWMMLFPLIVFAVLIIGFGLHSQPLMRFLTMIGGEAA